jgi:site-specific DNA-methyltransferase (adenine-specific)
MSEGKKEILLGDCLELMKDIPNGSIDMILCDLPYGTTKIKWDVVIPFDKLWEQYERIIKPNGAIILFSAQPFTSKLILSNIDCYKYELVWQKDRPQNIFNCKIQPLRSHENISVFYKNQPTYNPQFFEGKPNNSVGKGLFKSDHYSIKIATNRENSEMKYPQSVIFFKKEHPPIHPTQKPVGLMEWLINTYTNENDLVLDNCAGSGTTAIACLNTNRQFIVMEKEQKYYDIILKRVGDFNKKFETQTLFGNEM